MLAGLASDHFKQRVTRPWILAGAVIFMGVAHAIFLIPGEGMLDFRQEPPLRGGKTRSQVLDLQFA